MKCNKRKCYLTRATMCNAVQPRLVGADWCSPVCALMDHVQLSRMWRRMQARGFYLLLCLSCKINQHILRHSRPCKYLHAGLASCGFGRFLDFMRMDHMDRIDQYVDLLLNFVEGPRHIMYHHLMCCTCFVGWHICEFLWHPTVYCTSQILTAYDHLQPTS